MSISIIVPIYNVEQYIKKSLECLVNQTAKNIEIILVNDGSTDRSLEICQEYAQKDSRVIIIDKKNGGVSSARNAGLKVASGEYIGFMDPDDIIALDMYEIMGKALKENEVDVCVCNQNKSTYLDKGEVMLAIIGGQVSEIKRDSVRGVVFYLYKKEIIEENEICFSEKLSIGEDMLFNLNYLSKINKVKVINNKLYTYEIRPGSAMTGYRKNMIDNYITLQKKVEEITNKINLDQTKLDNSLQRMLVEHIITCISNEFKRDNNKSKREIISSLDSIINLEEIKKIKESITLSTYGVKLYVDLYCIIKGKSNILYYYRNFYYKIKRLF